MKSVKLDSGISAGFKTFRKPSKLFDCDSRIELVETKEERLNKEESQTIYIFKNSNTGNRVRIPYWMSCEMDVFILN